MSPPLEPHFVGPPAMAAAELKSTELRLGPPGLESPDRAVNLTLDLLPKPFAGAKRGFRDVIDAKVVEEMDGGKAPPAAVAAADDKKQQPPAPKAQVVGWPPVRSYRKNSMSTNQPKNKEVVAEIKSVQGCLYIKVSMNGAPYLRKVDLKTYRNYKELSQGLDTMFGSFTAGTETSETSENCMADISGGTEYVLTYEDKDGDWMLVGDIPWEMFIGSCRRLRIMKGSDAVGLAPRATDKFNNRN